ncbi:hypothetical protein GCM10027295_32260 [Pseudaeromonas pectinilytica]
MELNIGESLQAILAFRDIQGALGEIDQQIGHASAGAQDNDAGLGIIDDDLGTTAHGIGIGNTGTAKFGYAKLVHD